MPVHISHIKALGTDVWGRSDSAIAIIEAAQAGGQKVTANQYPYTASGSSVGASLLPRWAEVGGRDSLRARVAPRVYEFSLSQYRTFFDEPLYWHTFVRTAAMSILATVCTLSIAFPAA